MKLWRGQPDHDHWRKPPTLKERAYFLWGMSAVALALGLSSLASPSSPPFTGKWSWVYTWAYATFGSTGPAIAWLGLAAVLAAGGTFAWLRK